MHTFERNTISWDFLSSSFKKNQLLSAQPGVSNPYQAELRKSRINEKLLDITRILPSGKRLHNYGKSPFLMGKSTINDYKWQFSIAMFLYNMVSIESNKNLVNPTAKRPRFGASVRTICSRAEGTSSGRPWDFPMNLLIQAVGLPHFTTP